MSGASAVLEPGVPVMVAPGGHISFEIETGQRLRLTQPEREQVADWHKSSPAPSQPGACNLNDD
jgi:hypothetical protein